jgi:hypothetical protein
VSNCLGPSIESWLVGERKFNLKPQPRIKTNGPSMRQSLKQKYKLTVSNEKLRRTEKDEGRKTRRFEV